MLVNSNIVEVVVQVQRAKSGSGVLNYTNGNRYEGEYENDKRHGHGTLYYANGDKYVGQWKNDQKHGSGNFKWKNGIFVLIN